MAMEPHSVDHQPRLRGTMTAYKALIDSAHHENWSEVHQLLTQHNWEAFPEKAKNIVQAIEREMERSTAKSAIETKDENHDQQLISITYATFFSQEQEQFKQQVDDYCQHSRVYRYVDEDGKKIIRQALLAKRKMPTINWLKEREHFFWRFDNRLMDNIHQRAQTKERERIILKPLYSTPLPLQWSEFENFCIPYRQHNAFAQPMGPDVMVDCLPIYLISLSPNWEAFMEFCKPNLYSFLDGYDRLLAIKNLLPVYQAFHGDLEELNKFKKFCDSVQREITHEYLSDLNLKLLPIYQKFHDQVGLKNNLVNFCKPYLEEQKDYADEPFWKETKDLVSFGGIYLLLKAYPAFSDPTEKQEFINFCKQYKADPLNNKDKTSALLLIYQAFADPMKRQHFIGFCNQYGAGEDSYAMSQFLPIYQAFPDPAAMEEFINFCNLHGRISKLREYPREIAHEMRKLLSIYQAFYGNHTKLQEFTNFCNPYNQYKHADIMIELLPIYQYYRDDFEQFISRHTWNKPQLIYTYVSGTYLRFERALAVLQTQQNPITTHATYETKLSDQLPEINPADPHIAEVRGIAATANAHVYDPYYPIDYALLKAWCNDAGYTSTLAPQKHTIYNRGQSISNYQTTSEVEDFIRYLDKMVTSGQPINNMPPARAVSLVKQMLGLEAKADNTSGGFAPYLGHSMYYGRAIGGDVIDADGHTHIVERGDELLGRVWYFIKMLGREQLKIATTKPTTIEAVKRALKDEKAYKRSIVLAMLEAAEVSENSADTHCQTRMTGELLKAIAPLLQGSRLRPLIAGPDAPIVMSQDVTERIAAAPALAERLFRDINREGRGSNTNKLFNNNSTPELWQIYQAYYDDFYQRTMDGNGNISQGLRRDAQGNLVNHDGHIIYHQAEFQVLELNFTELMRKEFEEQRGLKY